MLKKIKILGNGQIWDIRSILPKKPDLCFEDIFSGRALAERAKKEALFRRFIVKRRLKASGRAVTEMLLNGDDTEKTVAKKIIFDMGIDGGKGIEAILRGIGEKEDWKDWQYWSDIDTFIIGGGVSEARTGDILIEGIKTYLKKTGFDNLIITKARFSGKEAGFLGAVAFIFERIQPKEAVIGVDLGRENIGVGIIYFDKRKKIIKNGKELWFFRKEKKTPNPIGLEFREKVVKIITTLIKEAVDFLTERGSIYSNYIGISTPGEVDAEGNLIGSTDFMPYFQKKDRFYFKKELEDQLAKLGYSDFEFQIQNDGIAAGLANLIFGLGFKKLKLRKKYAFLGVGSGLAGCLIKVTN